MNKRAQIQYAVTIAALTAVLIHHFWPGFRADAFTGTFLLVAVLPWLAPILKTIKLPGGLEVELRELQEQLDETKGAVKSAAIQAQAGAAALVSPGQTQMVGSVDKAPSRESLLALGAEYEQVRDSIASSSARTAAMTRVLVQMFKQADSIHGLDIEPLLLGGGRGGRLAGIAYAHQHPSPDRAEALVTMLLRREDTPFGQYWALRALRRIAELDTRVFGRGLREKLLTCRDRQLPGTDRYYEVTQLLRDIARDTASAGDS